MGSAEPTAEEVAAEALALWQNSSLSLEERAAWVAHSDAVTVATPSPGKKPTKEELAALQAAKVARDVFVAGLEHGRREELLRCMELQKREQKLRQKAQRQQSQAEQQQRKDANRSLHSSTKMPPSAQS